MQSGHFSRRLQPTRPPVPMARLNNPSRNPVVSSPRSPLGKSFGGTCCHLRQPTSNSSVMNKTPSPQAANNQDSNNQDGYRFDAKGALIETNLHSLLGSDANQIFAGPIKRGKVRDVYDMGDRLLIVSSDRISAFDFILPCGIPDKGRILTATSEFWFANLDVQHHLLSCDVPRAIERPD